MRKEIEIESVFDSEEFLTRFDQMVVPYRTAIGISKELRANWEHTRFVGRRKGGRIVLMRHMAYMKNAFSPVFIGYVTEKDSGCSIAGRFTKPAFVIIFTSIWLMLWMFAALILLLLSKYIVALALLLVGLLALAAMAYPGNNDRKCILRSLNSIAQNPETN